MFELSCLAVGAPTEIAVTRVTQIHASKLFKPTPRVEARGQFISERLVVGRAVRAGRADSLFVEVHGRAIAAFHPGDLGADQRCTVLEVFRTVLSPVLDLN